MNNFRCLATLSFLALLAHCSGHGVCVDPPVRGTCYSFSINNRRPRNPRIAAMYKYVRNPKCARSDCPHCLNGGGKGAVIKAAKGIWRPFEPLNKKAPFRRDSAMCGDPVVGAQPHQKGGRFAYPRSPIMKTYRSGSAVEFVVDLTTNHNGFFEFFVCDATKCDGDISESCFRSGHCQQLLRVAEDECESQRSRECGPIDPKYPGRWYVPCRKGAHVGEHFMGGPFMKYKLPDGLATEHAIIQWYWATANSCNPPGFLEYFQRFPMRAWGNCPGDGGARGGRNPTTVRCGGKVFPEEFWNCADVRILGSGSASMPDDDSERKEREGRDAEDEKSDDKMMKGRETRKDQRKLKQQREREEERKRNKELEHEAERKRTDELEREAERKRNDEHEITKGDHDKKRDEKEHANHPKFDEQVDDEFWWIPEHERVDGLIYYDYNLEWYGEDW